MKSYFFFAFLFLSLSKLSSQQIRYLVNTIDDNIDGVCDTKHCSFREAILLAEADNSLSEIQFSDSLPENIVNKLLIQNH